MKTRAIEYNITAKKQDFESVQICSSEDAAKFARKFYHEDILIYESVFIILLNQANKAIGYAKISQGGVCQTLVDKRIVAKYAIDSLASGVIFVHNHPSCNIKPSNEDICLTKSIKQGLDLFSIKLLDSIIITDENYYSMTDEGRI